MSVGSQAPKSVSASELSAAIRDHFHSNHVGAAGPFGPVLIQILNLILPQLVAFLLSMFNVTPKPGPVPVPPTGSAPTS